MDKLAKAALVVVGEIAQHARVLGDGAVGRNYVVTVERQGEERPVLRNITY